MGAADVIMFGADGQRRRASQFCADGCTILVRPDDEDGNEAAFALACRLSRAAAELADAHALIGALTSERDAARAALAPPLERALLGPGYVRFDSRGRLWLLGKREGGWAEFGYLMTGGWDELFRTYNVRVTATGTDDTGPWWQIEDARVVA